jgi:hypothetical protein
MTIRCDILSDGDTKANWEGIVGKELVLEEYRIFEMKLFGGVPIFVAFNRGSVMVALVGLNDIVPAPFVRCPWAAVRVT